MTRQSDFRMLHGPAGARLLDAPNHVASRERAARMLEIDLEYAECYFNGDFDGMEEYLVDVPAYEFYPQAIRMTGKEAVRARSERGFKTTMKQLDPYRNEDTREYRALAFSDDHMIGETTATFVLPDGTKKRCSYIAVIEFDGDKMVGERIYSDHYHARLRDTKFGPDFLKVPGVTLL